MSVHEQKPVVQVRSFRQSLRAAISGIEIGGQLLEALFGIGGTYWHYRNPDNFFDANPRISRKLYKKLKKLGFSLPESKPA